MLKPLISLTIGVAGALIIGLTVGWLPVLGVFLMMWGDNLTRHL